MLQSDIDKRFTYHPPKDGQPAIYEQIRAEALQFATDLNQLVPDGREKSLAITHLEDAVMWANAGVARSQAAGEPAPGHDATGATRGSCRPSAPCPACRAAAGDRA
jgi:hypothetical protein